jgi:hypothetical protein
LLFSVLCLCFSDLNELSFSSIGHGLQFWDAIAPHPIEIRAVPLLQQQSVYPIENIISARINRRDDNGIALANGASGSQTGTGAPY